MDLVIRLSCSSSDLSQLRYLEFLHRRRPDLDPIAEHMPLERVVEVRRRLDDLIASGEERAA